MSYTKPLSVSYLGAPEFKADNWTQVYVAVMNLLIGDYPHILDYHKINNFNSGNRIDYGDNAAVMVAPKSLCNGCWLETNYSAIEIIKKIRSLLLLCGVNFDDIKIEYCFAGGAVVVTSEKENKALKPPQDKHSWSKEIQLDFQDDISYAFTKPLAFKYFGEEHLNINSWADLYVEILKCLIDDYPDIVSDLKGENINGFGRNAFGDAGSQYMMRVPKQVMEDFYVEVNISATDIIKRLRNLLDRCRVDYENVEIIYSRKDDAPCKEKLTDRSDVSIAALEPAAINNKTFARYLSCVANMADSTCRGYASAITSCETFAREHGYDSSKLYTEDKNEAFHTMQLLFSDSEFLKFNVQRHNQFRAALKKFQDFLNATTIQQELYDSEFVKQTEEVVAETDNNPEQKNHIEQILREHFKEGLIPNAIRLDQFRMLYEDAFYEGLSQDDNELTKQIKACGIFVDGRIYPRQGEEQNSLLNNIREEIMRTLENGAQCVYISCVFERWQQELAESLSIYNEEALKDLLLREKMTGVHSTTLVFKLISGPADPSIDVSKVMRGAHFPMTYDQIKEILWYLTLDCIKRSLHSVPSIVQVDGETYIYAPNFPASPSELNQIKCAMKREIAQKEFLVAQDIKQIIHKDCPTVAINTPEYKDWAYRNVLSWLLRDDFEFGNSIVSEKGNKIEMWQAYRSFCRDHEVLSLGELKDFASEMGVSIYWGDVLNEMIRINESTMVRKDKVHFDVEKTDAVLDSMCPGDYISIREIELFLQFPPVNVPWNSFVLECYLRDYSKKFNIFQVSISQDRVCGAIVRKSSPYNSYEQVIIDFLAMNYSWKTRADALALIVENGYQARKRWSGFDKVMQAAIARRNEIKKREL